MENIQVVIFIFKNWIINQNKIEKQNFWKKLKIMLSFTGCSKCMRSSEISYDGKVYNPVV